MARMPAFLILIVLAACSGCSQDRADRFDEASEDMKRNFESYLARPKNPPAEEVK